MKELPKRIVRKLKEVEKKVVTYPLEEKLSRLKERYEDKMMNRELQVVDKYGNKYYQYYSHHGLPTKRVVLNNMKFFNSWDDDPIMMGWLQQKYHAPPSQEELEQKYIEQEEFVRRGMEWDRKEQEWIEAWKNKQKEAVESEREETQAIGDKETFEPGKWNKLISQTENSLVKKEDELIKIKEEELEGSSNLPGKYIMQFHDQDLEWMKRREEKMVQPYKDFAATVEWKDYTLEKMTQKCNKEELEARNKHAERKKELTNIGKKLLDKKKAYQNNYNNFRSRFKDVFKENDF